MKQSIIPNLLLNNRLVRLGLREGIKAWLILMLPLFLLTALLTHYFQSRQDEADQVKVEKILLQSLEREARFGDLVNAKESILNKGKAFKLEALHVCSQNQVEILPEITDFNCRSKIRSYPFAFNGEKARAFFVWEQHQKSSLIIIISLFGVFSICFILIIFFNSLKISWSLSEEIRAYSRAIANTDLAQLDVVHHSKYLPELSDMTATLKNKEMINLEYQSQLIQKEKSQAMVEVARRVAHDIRSPLSAINIISKKISPLLPQEGELLESASKQLLQLAEGLLKKSREQKRELPATDGNEAEVAPSSMDTKGSQGNPVAVGVLAQEVGSLLKQKELCAPQPEVRFSYHNDVRSKFDLSVDLTYLVSILSNVINNSIESIEDSGFISIGLSEVPYGGTHKLCIEVRDSGKGIPPEVLTQIGKIPISYGKENGNGIGLFSGISKIHSWGGEFHIRSELGLGTQVRILL